VDFSLPVERFIRSLNRNIEWRGKLGTTRVDNGPDYISAILPAQPIAIHQCDSTKNPPIFNPLHPARQR
jgi:putative transposase